MKSVYSKYEDISDANEWVNNFNEIFKKTEDPDYIDEQGLSFLNYAILFKNKEIVEFLLVKNAQVNLKTDQGKTALHWAAHYGFYKIVPLLLQRGGDITIPDDKGETPVTEAFNGDFRYLPERMKIIGMFINHIYEMNENDVRNTSHNNIILEDIKIYLLKNCYKLKNEESEIDAKNILDLFEKFIEFKEEERKNYIKNIRAHHEEGDFSNNFAFLNQYTHSYTDKFTDKKDYSYFRG